ncbi:MAG: serine protease [Pseudonocardiales bacterium]|nr:serine protease [Pseudonocardiales bacterium]
MRLLRLLAASILGIGLCVASATTAQAAPKTVRLCSDQRIAGQATCFALASVGQAPRATPNGLTPSDLASAYKLPTLTRGAGQTIAIVDAYGYTQAESDLAVYRAQYGLPACTTANGCFRKVDQVGGASYPRFDLGWAQEMALDLDAASAVCPKCKLLLVQANSPAFIDLGVAVNTAAGLGATVISNSYGGPDASDTTFGRAYNHPGIAITASTGDYGYMGASFPASSSYVTAVGGTRLEKAVGTARGWTESAWVGTGSGCSTINAALPAAAGFNTGCAKRAVSDVSAVADPNTGIAVFARTAKYAAGWQVFGGTSLSAPIIAGVYALAGNASVSTNSHPYHHPTSLFDVTSGRTDICDPAQLCTARVGWDGPTGLGTPNGLGAF